MAEQQQTLRTPAEPAQTRTAPTRTGFWNVFVTQQWRLTANAPASFSYRTPRNARATQPVATNGETVRGTVTPEVAGSSPVAPVPATPHGTATSRQLVDLREHALAVARRRRRLGGGACWRTCPAIRPAPLQHPASRLPATAARSGQDNRDEASFGTVEALVQRLALPLRDRHTRLRWAADDPAVREPGVQRAATDADPLSHHRDGNTVRKPLLDRSAHLVGEHRPHEDEVWRIGTSAHRPRGRFSSQRPPPPASFGSSGPGSCGSWT